MFNNDDGLVNTYISFRARLVRAISRIVPSKEIEDIVQETYVRVCQIENQSSIRHPRSFLLKTAKNLAFDYLKKAETRLTEPIDSEDDESLFAVNPFADETFDQVASNQEFALFCEAVRLLPVQCRKVFILKKVYGYSQRDIALELNLSESTVEKHIAQGIKRCMQFMEQKPSQSQAVIKKQKNGKHNIGKES